MKFGLQLPSYAWAGGPTEVANRLRDIVRTAEDVGFDSVWVMDHFRQIPLMGPKWAPRRCAIPGRCRPTSILVGGSGETRTLRLVAKYADACNLFGDVDTVRMSAEKYVRQTNAGTVEDQIGRFRALADAGVQTAIVSLPDVSEVEALERFAPIIAAFAG